MRSPVVSLGVGEELWVSSPPTWTATSQAAAGYLSKAVVIADSPVGFGCNSVNRTEGPDDDRRDDEAARAAGEEFGCRAAARDERFCRRAADGARGRDADRRGAWRAQPRAAPPAQRLPRPDLGNARRHARTAHPQAAQRQLLPGLSGAATDGREGPRRGPPGSLRPRRLDPPRRPLGQGDGDDRHLEEPGPPVVW